MARRSRKAAEAATAIEFKSATLTVPQLSLLGNDLSEISKQLGQKVAKSPAFFHDSPLLIDLQALTRQKLDVAVDLLIMLVREQGFLPVGIRGGTEAQHNDALMLNVPVLPLPAPRAGREEEAAVDDASLGATPDAPAAKAASQAATGASPASEPAPVPASAPAEPAAPVAAATDNKPAPENKLITQPVRSGQRVYARGDLTVMATVSAGAEILAEGNIHVYGSLRGRALAGVQGNETSRIFCMDLQAELISIAGIYQLRDDQQARPGKPVAISLESQALVIKEL